MNSTFPRFLFSFYDGCSRYIGDAIGETPEEAYKSLLSSQKICFPPAVLWYLGMREAPANFSRAVKRLEVPQRK